MKFLGIYVNMSLNAFNDILLAPLIFIMAADALADKPD